MNHSDGRVIAYTYAMPFGTSLTAAKAEVVRQLPSGATTTLFQVVTDSNANHCAFWNLRSATIARLLGPTIGDSNGDIGIELNSGPDPSDATVMLYKPADVDEAVISIAASDPTTTTC